MSVRLKILLTDGNFLTARQPGEQGSKPYIFCLTENDSSYFERLNKGLRSSQSDWFPGSEFTQDAVRDQSTYYTQTGPEFEGGGVSGINSTPKFHPWRFRSSPPSRLNELFWPTQLQRHAEMYVAFSIDSLHANLWESLRNAPLLSQSGSLGIDRVYILFGPNEVNSRDVTGPYFYMRCAGLHAYNGNPLDDNTIQENSVFIMKLVDDRYYWNKNFINPRKLAAGNLNTPADYFYTPRGITSTQAASRIASDWDKIYGTLQFTNKDNSNIYNRKNFGFTLYPHSFPSSGMPPGLLSDWTAWSQGYIPVVLPNFNASLSLSRDRLGESISNPVSTSDGYALLTLSPAFLGEDALYPKDMDNWHERFDSAEHARQLRSNLQLYSDDGRKDFPTRSAPDSAFESYGNTQQPYHRSTWPDVSIAHRAKGRRGFLGRIRIDLRENDILYGEKFITSDKLGEFSNNLGGDSPYHSSVLGASAKYNEMFLQGQQGWREFGTPMVTVNTSLFSNAIINTDSVSSYEFTGSAPENDIAYDPLSGNKFRDSDQELTPPLSDYTTPNYQVLIDAAKRISTQYEYLATLDTGPESVDYVNWSSPNKTRRGSQVSHVGYHENIHHSLMRADYSDEETSKNPEAFAANFFYTYESFTFAPLLTSAVQITQDHMADAQVSCVGASFRKDAIPTEMPITWSAPQYYSFISSTQVAKSLRTALHLLDNGQQIYAEGNVVKMTGFDDETYYMKITLIKPVAAINGTGPSEINFASSPIVRLRHPNLWPDELVPGTKISCLRIPEKSNTWWSDQWVPFDASVDLGTKRLVRFTLNSALTTSDTSKPATITDQYGPGTDNPNTAIDVYNLETHATGTYVFEGDSGDAGLAMLDKDQEYRIIQIECPDDSGGGDGDGGGDGGDGGDGGGPGGGGTP
tara:strand:+ start:4388 stop:7132 length:2745 start_codon:yes stop_codon:yes gene_type:complete